MIGRQSASANLQEFRQLAERPVRADDLLKDLKPPIHFDKARFDNYFPDIDYPSQIAAVERLKFFLSKIPGGAGSQFGMGKRMIGNTRMMRPLFSFLRWKPEGSGLYLDGGFGIGKTHLLAAAYHGYHGKKAYLTFQELMFLVGLQGLAQTVETLRARKLIVLDEFELDDPANTRISTNLLSQLFGAGVSIIASSNTPPGALGEGKFSVEFFKRELGELFSKFEIVRIDGVDYRKTHSPADDRSSARGISKRWLDIGSELPDWGGKQEKPGKLLVVGFHQLLEELSLAHPIRIRTALQHFNAIRISDVAPIADPHYALRFVYFVDKAYDDNLDFAATASAPIDQLFAPSIFHSGDTKKYRRAISRLEEMTSF